MPFQIQTDKEKLLYELDTLQRELEKAQVNTTRFQHEKEDFEVDAGRQREKNEKLQVGSRALQFAVIPRPCGGRFSAGKNKTYSSLGNGKGSSEGESQTPTRSTQLRRKFLLSTQVLYTLVL